MKRTQSALRPSFRSPSEQAPATLRRDLEALRQQVSSGRFQRGMALIAAFFSILSGGEAYFEHLRGSYNQRLMWTPIWVTPPMVAGAIGALYSERIARTLLPAASAVNLADGLLGFYLHLRGVYRMPGRFRNLLFNITIGPPLFAPLLFSAVGLLGLLATIFRREEL